MQEDSYCWHYCSASEGSQCWLLLEFTSCASRASPALRIFPAAFSSALAVYPQFVQQKWAWVLRLSFETWPHLGQVLLVFLGLICKKIWPLLFCLYSSILKNFPQPSDRMERLSPDFAFTFLPGFNIVPLALFVIFLIFSSSATTIAWLLHICVLSFWWMS